MLFLVKSELHIKEYDNSGRESSSKQIVYDLVDADDIDEVTSKVLRFYESKNESWITYRPHVLSIGGVIK